MEQLLICMSLSLIAGLLASRAAKAIRLPAVTSYLVAGLLLGHFFMGRLGLSGWGFGFGSLAQVESYGIITQVALGFIAFVIGNEFRLSALESMGRQAVTVGILQAVITTVLVDIALVALHFARPDVISMASAITLGAIASATAPAATLMVVKQYKASGPLTRLLLMVVAIDDAVGCSFRPLSASQTRWNRAASTPSASFWSLWWRSYSAWVWARWQVCCSTSWRSTSTPAPSA